MIAVGKGDVQVAQMLRKPWVCLMKQKGQPWEGRSCPSHLAPGWSGNRGMWGVWCWVKDNGLTVPSPTGGVQAGSETPVP